MKVVVTGATGTIGAALVEALVERGDEVTALSRDAGGAREKLGVDADGWADPKSEPAPAEALRGRDAVVHLLGEPVAQRWTRRGQARDPRLPRCSAPATWWPRCASCPTTSGRACSSRSPPPAGTGPRATSGWTSRSPAAGDFLAAGDRRLGGRGPGRRGARRARGHDPHRRGALRAAARSRRCCRRSSSASAARWPAGKPVRALDPPGRRGGRAGLLPRQRRPRSGPVNLTAPEPVTNRELSKALGRVLHRPAFAPVPALAVKLLYGEMASIVTTGRAGRSAPPPGAGLRVPAARPRGRAARRHRSQLEAARARDRRRRSGTVTLVVLLNDPSPARPLTLHQA